MPIVKANSPKIVLKSAISIAKFNGIKKLDEITVPTMIIHGCKDRHIVIIQMAKKLHEKIQNSKLFYIKDAGHFSPNEQPEIVIKHLTQFLKSIS